LVAFQESGLGLVPVLRSPAHAGAVAQLCAGVLQRSAAHGWSTSLRMQTAWSPSALVASRTVFEGRTPLALAQAVSV
jgi:hypothetical protein